MMTDQLSMFREGEDLPLFSGTPQRVEIKPFAPQPASQQEPLPVQCRVCFDTGRVAGKLCWCEAGQRIRKGAT
jgi:hypothetical protein